MKDALKRDMLQDTAHLQLLHGHVFLKQSIPCRK